MSIPEHIMPESVDALVSQWYVRTAENAVYGPARFAELAVWAAEARIVPGCMVSCDGATWFPAETVERLRMEWTLALPGGDTIGPLSLLAIGDLVRDGAVPRGSRLTHRSGKTAQIDEHFFELVVSEARETLASFVLEEATLIDTARKRLAGAIEKVKNEFSRDVKMMESSREEFRLRCETAEAAAHETAGTLQSTHAAFQALTAQAEELSKAGERQSHYLKNLETSENNFRQRCEAAEASAHESGDALAMARRDIQSLTIKVESLSKAAGEPTLYVKNLEAEQEELRRRCEVAEKAARESSEILQATRAEVYDMASKAEALNRAGEKHLQHVKMLEASGEVLRQRCEAAQAAADESARSLQAAQSALQAMTAQADEAQHRVDEESAERKRLSAALEQQHVQEKMLHHDIESLTQVLKQRLVELDQMRVTMTAANHRIKDFEIQQAASTQEVKALTLQRDALQTALSEQRVRSADERSQRERRTLEIEENLKMRQEELDRYVKRLAEQEHHARLQADEFQAAINQRQKEIDELTTRVSQEHHESATLRAALASAEEQCVKMGEALHRERDEARMQRVKQDAVIQQTRDSLEAFSHREEQLTREKNELLRRLQVTEAELRSEIESLDRETAVLAEMLDQVRPSAGTSATSKPTSRGAINWMAKPSEFTASSQPLSSAGDDERWVAHLRSTSALLRRAEKELEKKQQLYHDLEIRSRTRENELNRLMAQLKRDVETSAALVRQSMNEIERREADLRALRQSTDAREKELLSRINAMAHVPVGEPEVLPPDTTENTKTATGETSNGNAKPHRILAGLEAQAQVELQAWHKQQRETQSESGTALKLKNWLRRSKT